jgi:hypothetical protein
MYLEYQQNSFRYQVDEKNVGNVIENDIFSVIIKWIKVWIFFLPEELL